MGGNSVSFTNKFGLSEKQARFCEYYAKTLNGTESALKAGYSKKSAYAQSSQHLKKLKIQQYIKHLRKKVSQEIKVDHVYILNKLKNWLETDVTETINVASEDIKKLPKELRLAISSYKINTRTLNDGTKETTIDLRFTSKEKAIELLGKHIGFFEKDNKQKDNAPKVIINLGGGINPEDETT